jgi:hypothetical protein
MTLDREEAMRRKEAGIHLASQSRAFALSVAQQIARAIAETNGTVTSDDVAQQMEAEGIPYDSLGNAAGAVFRSGFAWTGRVFASSRPSSHGRIIREWRIDDEPRPAAPRKPR